MIREYFKNASACPECGASIPLMSRFCNICGAKVTGEQKEEPYNGISDDIPITDKVIKSPFGDKHIKIFCRDITKYKGDMDILTISAGARSLEPTPGTVIEALEVRKSIFVRGLFDDAYYKMKGHINCWLSNELDMTDLNDNIHRIGCIQRCPYDIRVLNNESEEEGLIRALKAYYRMLDVLAENGIKMDTIVMPLLGTGSLNMEENLIVYPLVNEAIASLKRNGAIKEIVFIERSLSKAQMLAECINSSYQLMSSGKKDSDSNKPCVFISYTTKGDYEIARIMSELLDERGIKNWFAPKDIKYGDYASRIVEGIDNCSHFICLVSKNSMLSPHVLNEVDLAFQHISDGVTILPFKLDDDELTSSFKYYLSRMQWNYGNPPPLIERINDFLDRVGLK